MPLWYQFRLRAKNQRIMRDFRGRKVVEDVEKFYETREREEGSEGVVTGAEASTVLVEK
jgi:hypothetical protein